MSFDSVLAGSKGLRGKRNGTRTKLAGISGSRIFKTIEDSQFRNQIRKRVASKLKSDSYFRTKSAPTFCKCDLFLQVYLKLLQLPLSAYPSN
jgi:hypothetical protein